MFFAIKRPSKFEFAKCLVDDLDEEALVFWVAAKRNAKVKEVEFPCAFFTKPASLKNLHIKPIIFVATRATGLAKFQLASS